MPSSASSPQASSGLPSMEVMPIPNKTIIENKSSVYAGVVRDLNDARGRSVPFNVSFKLSVYRFEIPAPCWACVGLNFCHLKFCSPNNVGLINSLRVYFIYAFVCYH
jgi:hypothetical protein